MKRIPISNSISLVRLFQRKKIYEKHGLKKKKKRTGTFHRPASRPYFLVTSSAEAEEAEGEEDEDGSSISWVLSFRALTLKRFKLAGGGEKDERHWRSLTLSCPSHNQEEDESEGTCNAVVIATRPKIFSLSKHPLVLPSVKISKRI